VLFDRGYVSTDEPFQRLVNQGMILGHVEFTGYRLQDGSWVSAAEVSHNADGDPVRRSTLQPVSPQNVSTDEVTKRGDQFVLVDHPEILIDSRSHKMSKARGNVVNPDEIVRDYGADALRLYEMFMGPLEATKPWNMAGVGGVRGFLDRVWRMIVDERSESLVLNRAVQDVPPSDEQLRPLHKTIKAVTEDLESLHFNTAIARMMEFVNFFTKQSVRPRSAMQDFVLLLSPLAPHICEELWGLLGHQETLALEPWPEFDPALTVDATVEIPVQINGKVRSKISVPSDISKVDLEAAAKADDKVQQLLAERTIKKAIIIPGRLVNFVV
jgi:leucyl-tRNA synthetase